MAQISLISMPTGGYLLLLLAASVLVGCGSYDGPDTPDGNIDLPATSGSDAPRSSSNSNPCGHGEANSDAASAAGGQSSSALCGHAGGTSLRVEHPPFINPPGLRAY